MVINMNIIGYIDDTYAERRLLINKMVTEQGKNKFGYQYLERLNYDFANITIAGTKKLWINKHPYLLNREAYYFHPVISPKVQIIHTFNTVCDTKLPWIASFETCLPRYTVGSQLNPRFKDYFVRKSLEKMEKDNCIQLLAISNRALECQKILLKDFGYIDIMNKTSVLHPPQEIYISEERLEEKYFDVSQLECLFVGHAFFVKGGKEMLEGLIQLRKEYNIHLTIVSSFLTMGMEDSKEDKQYRRECMKLIDENKTWIKVYRTLSNRQVIKLAQKAHLGFLPSYVDTYGYSVLEMQACGCPVITSDIHALPEINNENCGWLSHLNQYDDLNLLREENRKQILKILQNIIQNIGEIGGKARQAVDRVQKEHSPKKYEEKLINFYQRTIHL